MTDHIRDEDLASLIAWAETSNDLVLRALLELRERRNEEQPHVTECGYCGEYHDDRVACNPYQGRHR